MAHRMPNAWRGTLRALACGLFCGGLLHGAAEAADAGLRGTWRVVRGVAAPWLAPGGESDLRAWLGRMVRFDAQRVDGPGVLHCDKARYQPAASPAEGLFQGMLPSPAVRAAETLGFARVPVPGTRLTCSAGVFDFHRADEQTVLVAVDNVVWTLSRAPGALAEPAAPGGVVQALLERHFAGDMGFDPASVAAKRDWLSPRLAARIDSYFARPWPEDEPPPIDGDPFTDSQEYPARFAVGRPRLRGAGAVVPVRFADAYRERRVSYRLIKAAGGWRVDELVFEDGRRFTAMLE